MACTKAHRICHVMSIFCCTPQSLYLRHSLKIGHVFNRVSPKIFTKNLEIYCQNVRQNWQITNKPWQLLLVRTSWHSVTGRLSCGAIHVRRGRFSCRWVSWFSEIILSSPTLTPFKKQQFYFITLSSHKFQFT